MRYCYCYIKAADDYSATYAWGSLTLPQCVQSGCTLGNKRPQCGHRRNPRRPRLRRIRATTTGSSRSRGKIVRRRAIIVPTVATARATISHRSTRRDYPALAKPAAGPQATLSGNAGVEVDSPAGEAAAAIVGRASYVSRSTDDRCSDGNRGALMVAVTYVFVAFVSAAEVFRALFGISAVTALLVGLGASTVTLAVVFGQARLRRNGGRS